MALGAVTLIFLAEFRHEVPSNAIKVPMAMIATLGARAVRSPWAFGRVGCWWGEGTVIAVIAVIVGATRLVNVGGRSVVGAHDWLSEVVVGVDL